MMTAYERSALIAVITAVRKMLAEIGCSMISNGDTESANKLASYAADVEIAAAFMKAEEKKE